MLRGNVQLAESAGGSRRVVESVASVAGLELTAGVLSGRELRPLATAGMFPELAPVDDLAKSATGAGTIAVGIRADRSAADRARFGLEVTVMTPRTTPTRIADAERRALALQLKRQGWTYDEIAAHQGADGRPLYTTRQAANRAVLRELRALPRDAADDLRTLELHRLDTLLARVWSQTDSGRKVTCPECQHVVDHAPSLNAVTVALRIGERRARLVGLDVDAVRLREQITREVWATLTDRMEMALACALDSAGVAAITDDVLDFLRPWLRRGAGPNPRQP